MKKFFALALLAISTTAAADSVIVNGTRFIYPSNEKEITVQLKNLASTPALIQTWLDTGDAKAAPDDITTPFSITPPIAKINGKGGQTLRIRMLNRNGVATDRESLWYLNVLEVPSTVKKEGVSDENTLMMAMRSRFKFIYRPVELGLATNVGKKLNITSTGKMVKIENPTPFYVTIASLKKSDNSVVSLKTEMIEPKSTKSYVLKSTVSKGEQLGVVTINDYGSREENTVVVK